MKYIVTVPVTDLRKIPQPYKDNIIQDLTQESQCLYGELLRVIQVKDGWAQVLALEQKIYREGKWTCYPGWIDAKHIQEIESYPEYNLIVKEPFFETQYFSVGTRLLGLEKSPLHWSVKLHDGKMITVEKHYVKETSVQNNNLRDEIISHSACFIGSPYHWGGRSSYIKDFNQKTSLDCSALTQLLYRLEQIDIPRDAHDQYLASKEIERKDLKKADFIFLKKVDKPRIDHVMLYVEKDLLLESTIDPGIVRIVSCKDKLGKMLSDISSGDTVNGNVVTFGTVLVN